MKLSYLLSKEFKLIKRNPIIPRLIIIMPILFMLIFPHAANMDIRNINLTIVDNDNSSYSKQLAQKIASSGYFRVVTFNSDYNRAFEQIESGKCDLIMEIPSHFESDLRTGQNTSVMVAANAIDATKAGMGSNYLIGIVGNYANDLSKKIMPNNHSQELISVQLRFNPYNDYKIYMIPALMVILLTILCGFLPALNIVGEKETGTIEQMNVSPVGKLTFMLGKLIPFWIIGFVILTISLLISYLLYGLLPIGNMGVIYLGTSLFILTISGFGLVISSHSQNMQQAMFVMFFFILILILLSGLFTPISSMPDWAQFITAINPLRYFIEIMRGVYLRGSTLSEIAPCMYKLMGFATFFIVWATLSYKKSGQ